MKGMWPVKSWVLVKFVGDADLTGDLRILKLQLSLASQSINQSIFFSHESNHPPSPLIPIISGMGTFWYKLITVVLEKGC